VLSCKLSACVRNITALCQHLLRPIKSAVLADTDISVNLNIGRYIGLSLIESMAERKKTNLAFRFRFLYFHCTAWSTSPPYVGEAASGIPDEPKMQKGQGYKMLLNGLLSCICCSTTNQTKRCLPHRCYRCRSSLQSKQGQCVNVGSNVYYAQFNFLSIKIHSVNRFLRVDFTFSCTYLFIVLRKQQSSYYWRREIT